MVPREPGTYALILHLPGPVTVAVGRLGQFRFDPGWYAYAGSARGPGGLAARVQRHCRTRKALHWHIDYLHPHGEPVAVWYAVGSQKRECRWAKALSELPGASSPAPRFGASDCQCPTHLIAYPNPPASSDFSRAVDVPVFEELLDV